MFVAWVKTELALYWISVKDMRFVLAEFPDEAHRFVYTENAEYAVLHFIRCANELRVPIETKIERVA